MLWYNWNPQRRDSRMGVAESYTPVGPFTIVNDAVKLAQAADKIGDGSVFVDDDGTGYFTYTVNGADHAIWIERLTKDFRTSTGETSGRVAKGYEAPVMFKRGEF